MQANGTSAPAFEAVRTASAANVAAANELGASVAATVDVEPVVDLWASLAASDGRPRAEDAVVMLAPTRRPLRSF